MCVFYVVSQSRIVDAGIFAHSVWLVILLNLPKAHLRKTMLTKRSISRIGALCDLFLFQCVYTMNEPIRIDFIVASRSTKTHSNDQRPISIGPCLLGGQGGMWV